MLQKLKNGITYAFHLFVFGNLWVAFGGIGLALSTLYVLGFSKARLLSPLFLFIFFSILFIYNFDRLFATQEDEFTIRHKWIKDNRLILQIITFLAVPPILTLVFFLPVRVIVILTVTGIISVGYSIPITKIQRTRLKEIGILKIFLITLVWCVVTVWVPMEYYHLDVSGWDWLLIFLERFLFIFAIVLPFDVRDLRMDESINLHTIPGRVGVLPSLALALLLLVLFTVLIILDFQHDFLKYGLPQILAGCYTAFLVLLWKPKRKEYYYTFWLDGSIVVYSLLVIGIHFLFG